MRALLGLPLMMLLIGCGESTVEQTPVDAAETTAPSTVRDSPSATDSTKNDSKSQATVLTESDLVDGIYLVDSFSSQRDAAADLTAAGKLATNTNRNILLEVGGDWWGWCKILDKFVHTNEAVSNALRASYIVVKVNYSQKHRNEAFLGQYPRIGGYPHIFVLDSNGKLLHSQDTGRLEAGKGYDQDKFLAFLDRFKPATK